MSGNTTSGVEVNPWVEPVPSWMADMTVRLILGCVLIMYVFLGMVSLYCKFRK